MAVIRLLKTHLNGAAATALHDVADMSRLNASSDERLHIVVVQFFQLHHTDVHVSK